MKLTPNQIVGKGFKYILTSQQNLSGTTDYATVGLDLLAENGLGGTASAGTYTVPYDGLYLFTASLFASGTNKTELAGRLFFDRADGNIGPRIGWNRRVSAISDTLPISGSLVMRMKSGDTVRLGAYTNTATTGITGGGVTGQYTFVMGTYLGA